MKHRIRQYAIHIGRVTVHVSRWSLYVSAALLVLLTLVFVVARYLLPVITEQKSYLEQYLSERSGHQVRIESLHAHWDGLYPGARARGLRVFAADGTRPAVTLNEVRLSVSLLPLLWGEIEINRLVLMNPSLSLERLKDGRYRISGFNPLQEDGQGQGDKFVGWLFQQGRLEIENGELQWFDHREGGEALRLLRVNLSLDNKGARHRLGFRADFPDGMCDECSLHLDVTGNPLLSSEWEGDIHVGARHMDVGALPLIAREKLPKGFRGRFALQLASEWEQGLPVSIRGHAQVKDLRLPVRTWRAPLTIREASGDVQWRKRRTGWRLDVANPHIGLRGPAWAGGHLRLGYEPDASELQIKHMNLGDITGFVAGLKNEIAATTKTLSGETPGLIDIWLAISPEGAADNFALHLEGDWLAPKEYSLETDIRNGVALFHQDYPGVKGLNGHLSLSRERGNFRLQPGGITLYLPRVFRHPIEAEQIAGELSWERYTDYWLVNGSGLRLNGEDGRGTGKLSLRLPHDPAESPALRLRVDFQDGNGARASRYYPVAHLSKETLAWMEQSFLGGEITSGHLIYDGPIREFPFDNGKGKFELRAHVRNGVYRYLPGWEPIRQAEADVALNGSRVSVTGSGKIGKLDATQVVVNARETGAGDYVVRVGGKVSGPLGEKLHVLRQAASGPEGVRWFAYLPTGLQASGLGQLSLDLTIPVSDERLTTLLGEYRFLNNTLQLSGLPVVAENIEGDVRFTETGIREGKLQARILGGDTVLTAVRDQQRLAIQAQGAITAQGLAHIVGSKIAPRLSGKAPWTGSLEWGGEAGTLLAEADLHGLKVALPAPLNRPDGLAQEKLIVRTESSQRGRILLGVGLGNYMNGKLAFSREGQAWTFTGGRIGFGQANVALPKERELYLSASLGELDADQWWRLLGGGGTPPATLTHISADIDSLTLFDRKFGQLSVDLFRKRDDWNGAVNGTAMFGNIMYAAKGDQSSFEMDLERLAVPDKHPLRGGAPPDPRHLPFVRLRSKSFEWRGKKLGELDFLAIPAERGWRIQNLALIRPEMKLNVSGNWHVVNNVHASEFDVLFESSNLGDSVTAFGAPDQVAGGEANVKASLAWPGPVMSPRLAELNGQLNITAKKGRFLQVKTGAGRMFGLLDLSAIGRYLTLDFSPVFGKGFIYDEIQGKVRIEKGNAHTREFSIRGPATAITVDGRIGLAAENFDLTIDVQPKLSDTVTIATWGFLGPQVAAAVLAVQKLFKKQIAEGTRITYVVKGPWDNPDVKKQIKGKVADSGKKSRDDEASGQ